MRRVQALVCLGVFMGSLDASVVNVAYPTLAAAFAAQLPIVAWVSVAYLLTRSSLLAIFGRLSDMRGHKRIYVTGFAIFLLGSVLCGLAPGIVVLIICRMLQAVGAAMLSANSIAILSLHVPRARMGMALSLVETSVSVALGVGPVLGGLLIQAFGWRAIFYMNVPVSLTALWLAGRILPPMAGSGRGESFDTAGAATFAFGLGGTLLGISLAQDVGWGSWLSLGPLGCGLALIAAFLRLERRRKHPMLDLALFRSRSFSAANVAKLLAYATSFAVTFTVPFYLEELLGYSPGALGLAMIPLPVALAVGSLIGGPLSDRFGSHVLAPAGMAVSAVGCLLFTRVEPARGYAMLLVAMVLLEFGSGLFLAPNDSMVMRAAPRAQAGVASGVLALMRNLGQMLGITFAATFFQARLAAHASALAASVLAGPARDRLAFVASFHDVYYVTTLICLAGLGMALLR